MNLKTNFKIVIGIYYKFYNPIYYFQYNNNNSDYVVKASFKIQYIIIINTRTIFYLSLIFGIGYQYNIFKSQTTFRRIA